MGGLNSFSGLMRGFFRLILLVLMASPNLFGECVKASGNSIHDGYCYNLEASASYLSSFGSIDANEYGRVSSTLGLRVSFFSVHFSGYQTRVVTKESDIQYRRSTRYLYTQIGEPGKHRWRLLVGRYSPLFGVNLPIAMNVVRHAYKNENRFWPSFGPSLTVLTSDLVSTRLEVSVSEGEYESVVVGRLIYDWSALDGMRLVVSMLKSNLVKGQLGISLVNSVKNKGRSVVEWIRRYENHSVAPYGFRQLIRLSYLGNYQKDSRWLFEYEDDVNDYYKTILGKEFRLYEMATFESNIGYYRSRFKEFPNHWFVAVGLKAQL